MNGIKKTDPHIIVIFGGSGDLTIRKLIPALFNLHCRGFLPPCFAILGLGRTPHTDDSYREKAVAGNPHLLKNENADSKNIKDFARHIYYHAMDSQNELDYENLKDRIADIDEECSTEKNYVFYLSTPPSLYQSIAGGLAKVALNQEEQGWKRLIVEKPFGYDLKSASALNAHLLTCFQEEQIYRIDHYLGKETVQNVLVTRFANSTFEPIWNRNYIHHVEITAAESVGVEKRGGYYESSGALRDMVQNHLLQLVALVAMEPPNLSSAAAIRDEKLKLFQSLRPLTVGEIRNNVIRGQYVGSRINGESFPGYREEEGVKPDSKTETYTALKFYIDNWRWADVPFYIRTGKKLPTRVTEIVVHFKPTPHRLFTYANDHINAGNTLVIRIQPNEGILLKFGVKIPGEGFRVTNTNMDFHYSKLAESYLPDAYERLLLDCIQGDATLYSRGDSVEAAWTFINPILSAWQEFDDIKVFGYPVGTWGPEHADQLIEGKNFTWRYPCKNLTGDGAYCEL